jgi:lipid-binding SYLF domain-containing protein
MRFSRTGNTIAAMLSLVLLGASISSPTVSHAATAQEINSGANQTLEQFRSQVPGAAAILRDAKGILIFPQVIQAGIGIGGEYGEGVLQVGGRNAAYYSIQAGSWGFQFGAESKSIIIAFLTEQTLRNFETKAAAGNFWQAGVDGSLTVVNAGGHASVNTTTADSPVVAFVFDQKGLMYNLSLQGANISQIQR